MLKLKNESQIHDFKHTVVLNSIEKVCHYLIILIVLLPFN